MNNIYTPDIMKVEEIKQETSDIKTFKLIFDDKSKNKEFTFKAGQFCQLGVFGEGEATFCIASSPTRKGYIECSIKEVGKVTRAFHELQVGDTVGFRGPYGNWFPIDTMKKKNIIFVGGGIGLAPLRSLIWNCLDLRKDFKDILILYGARSISDLVYKDELKEWEERKDIQFVKTVDPGGEDKDWDGEIGFVPTILREIKPSPKNAIVVTCGPPIMIKFSVQALDAMGFTPERIVTTLEMRMKCGIGKCGRCNIGNLYVCKDGPVFSYDQLFTLPDEY
ncbi:MAG: heterodisulfide reductase subunit F [Candidatus Cloacimonadota bacterium]|nr:MAG: heterodisulfide reductase subunit F [Candidatus Cloacimonadota bacterium]